MIIKKIYENKNAVMHDRVFHRAVKWPPLIFNVHNMQAEKLDEALGDRIIQDHLFSLQFISNDSIILLMPPFSNRTPEAKN